jgi:Dolichyl-phosphate-mannose-protein mannosyltransferase
VVRRAQRAICGPWAPCDHAPVHGSRRTWVDGAVLLAALAVLRAPTLFEPPWSADAGAYANIGRALHLGGVLYRTVWDNKPPGVYWLAAALTAGGASALRVQLGLAVLVAAGTLLVWGIGRRLASPRAGLVGALLFAVLASVPNFTGDQLNAEIAGEPLVLAAMLVLVWRFPISAPRALVAGSLLGAALLFKATFATDLLAALAIPVLVAAGEAGERRRPGWRDAGRSALVAAGAGLLVAAALVPLWRQGALPALVDVVVRQDVRYARWAQVAGAGPVDFGARPGALLQALALTRLLAVLGTGAATALVLTRRGHRAGALLAWWLACDLAVTMADSRAFTHYALSMVGALALAAGLAADRAWRARSPGGVLLGAAALVATWPVILGALFLPRLEAALALGQGRPPLTQEGSSGRGLPAYYLHALGLLGGRLPLAAYQRSFAGTEYPSDEARAALLRQHSRPGDPVFVWGWTSSWVYALADRPPASRFVWMNTAYHLDPEGPRLLHADLALHPPAVLLAEQSPDATVRGLLSRLGYSVVHEPLGDCWLAPWAPGASRGRG